MQPSHEIAIVGLGAMGSAAACHLAKRGRKVLGFDLSSPPHTLGSTHGESRIIREAYFEHPLYVPLVQRSYELWYDLQKESKRDLIIQTGGLLIGPKEGTLVGGTRFSADRYRLDYEILAAKEIRKRYPVFRVQEGRVGLFEPRAGILLPEACVTAHMRLAEDHGADLHREEPVLEWRPDGEGVRLKTTIGEYAASKLLLTPGAWMRHFIPDLKLPLTVERQVLYWFRPRRHPEDFELERLPIFAWEHASEELFYGIPDLGTGVKVALHHQGVLTDPDELDDTVYEVEVETIKQILAPRIPDLAGELVRTAVCMYTNTPDEHFLIDFHPDLPQVLIASCCSGHGFKFAAAVGEILADLLTTGKTAFDVTAFRVARLMEGRR